MNTRITNDPANYWYDCKHPGYVSIEYAVGYGLPSVATPEMAEELIAEICKHCGRPIKDLRLIDEDRLAGGM